MKRLPKGTKAQVMGTRLFQTMYTADQMRKAVADEREACAKICDGKVGAEYATGKVDHNEMGWTQSCAIDIRARDQS